MAEKEVTICVPEGDLELSVLGQVVGEGHEECKIAVSDADMPQNKNEVLVPWSEVLRCWTRDSRALTEVAKKLLKNEDDAKEVCQDALGSFFLSRPNGLVIELRGRTPGAAVTAYIRGVVRNHAYNRWRKSWYRRETEPLPEDLAREIPSPEETLLVESFAEELKAVANRLPRKSKELLLFIMDHPEDIDPNEQWLLWAKKNGLGKDKRNSFDQQKKRLKDQLLKRGIQSGGERRNIYGKR